MEPFRQLVDCAARRLTKTQGDSLDTDAKRALVRLIAVDLPLGESLSPVSVAITKLAISLGQSFETGRLELALPRPPDPLTLTGLGQTGSKA